MGCYLRKKYQRVLYIYRFRENEEKRNYEFCLINYAKITRKIDQVLRKFATLEDEINFANSVTILLCSIGTFLKFGALKRVHGLFEKLSFRALRNKVKIE